MQKKVKQKLTQTLAQYAGVMGLKEDLQLKGNDFSNAATAFWIAFLIAQPPNSTLPSRLFVMAPMADVFYQHTSFKRSQRQDGSD